MNYGLRRLGHILGSFCCLSKTVAAIRSHIFRSPFSTTTWSSQEYITLAEEDLSCIDKLVRLEILGPVRNTLRNCSYSTNPKLHNLQIINQKMGRGGGVSSRGRG